MTRLIYDAKQMNSVELERMAEFETYYNMFTKYESAIGANCFDVGNSILMVKEFLYTTQSNTDTYKNPEFIKNFNIIQDLMINYVKDHMVETIEDRQKFITLRVLVNSLYGVTVPKSDFIIKNPRLRDVLDIFLYREAEVLELKKKIEKLNDDYLKEISENTLKSYDDASKIQEKKLNDKLPEGSNLPDGILNSSIYRPLVVGNVTNGKTTVQDVLNIYVFLSTYRATNAKLEDLVKNKNIVNESNMFPEYEDLNEVVYKNAEITFEEEKDNYEMLRDGDKRLEGFDERLSQNKEFFITKSAYDLFLNTRTLADNPTKAVWLADRRIKWALNTKDAFSILNTIRNNLVSLQNVSIGKLIDTEDTLNMCFKNNGVFLKMLDSILDGINEYSEKIIGKDSFKMIYVSNLIQFVTKYLIKPNWEKPEIKGKRIVENDKKIEEQLKLFENVKEKALNVKNKLYDSVVEDFENRAIKEIENIFEERKINYRMISVALGINSAVLSKIRSKTRRIQQLEYFIDICAMQNKTLESMLKENEITPINIKQTEVFF